MRSSHVFVIESDLSGDPNACFRGAGLYRHPASLASALVYLMRDKGTTNRTVNALTVRIGLSVALFLFVLFAHHMGWIESTGIR